MKYQYNKGKDEVIRELPKFLCTKKVWAIKITDTQPGIRTRENPEPSTKLIPEDKKFSPIIVDWKFVKKHSPITEGYFVLYEDGYVSFSPVEPFENGYILDTEKRDDKAREDHEYLVELAKKASSGDMVAALELGKAMAPLIK